MLNKNRSLWLFNIRSERDVDFFEMICSKFQTRLSANQNRKNRISFEIFIDVIYKNGHWRASRRIPAMMGFFLAAVGLVAAFICRMCCRWRFFLHHAATFVARNRTILLPGAHGTHAAIVNPNIKRSAFTRSEIGRPRQRVSLLPIAAPYALLPNLK